jgi:hypothetical protein
MSRNTLLLEKADIRRAAPALEPILPSGEYRELVHRLLPPHSALAVVDVGTGTRSENACQGIAAQLAASGKRVVIVCVEALLRADRVPDLTNIRPGNSPNVWSWPSTVDAPIEFFRGSIAAHAETDWLGFLRRSFDAVLLHCPSPESGPSSSGAAALADAVVLVIESGQTDRAAIRRTQHTLQSSGARLAGCILMQRR